MDVIFKRTRERRYAVSVAVPGQPLKSMSPAPGYDDNIPHDLVHYVVEAALGLSSGVYGRAARGGGTFIGHGEELSARERARSRRKQQKHEASLRQIDESHRLDMDRSERFAALCDLAWRRKHGQRPDPTRPLPREQLSPDELANVELVVSHLDRLAPLWRALPVGGELAFVWPSLDPNPTGAFGAA